jgi:uncharacterized protein (TIGR00375 family)
MKEFNVDLHIHSRYSRGVSPSMNLETVCEMAPIKGINIVGTGDCLYLDWLKELESKLEDSNGAYKREDTYYVLQCEVETTVKGRVHHLILFPSFSSVYELRDKVLNGGYSKLTSGRPILKLSPERLADFVLEAGALIGPSHAFTPWTSMYAFYESIFDCYGHNTVDVYFLELGLSADTNMTKVLTELDNCTFVSFSDAHSPYPDKLGRELTRFKLKNPSFAEIKKALMRICGRDVTVNVGLDPREGKYHLTGCTRCKMAYTLDDIVVNGTLIKVCPLCGGPLKIGVKDRIAILSRKNKRISTVKRPPYLHIVPLLEILRAIKGHSTTKTKSVRNMYYQLIKEFENEINILVDVPLSEIAREHLKLAETLQKFRDDQIEFEFVGRAGHYGKIKIQ